MTDIDTIARRIEEGEGVRKAAAALSSAQLVELGARTLPARARSVLFDLMGERRDAGAVDALCAGLADSDPKARASAADALGKIGDRRAGAALLSAIAAEGEPFARRSMLAALYTAGEREAVPVLRAFLTHEDPGHRAFAARSLGGLGAMETGPDLERQLAVEPDPFARAQLTEALGRLKPADEPLSALLAALTDPRPPVRAAAARKIAERNEISATGAVEAACASEYDRPTLGALRETLEHLIRAAKRR